MPDYRRYYVPGGTYFFTVVTHLRRPILGDELGRRCLREAINEIRGTRPFKMQAIVLLPEHLHAIWTLPRGDADYPVPWRRIKEEFTERFLAAGGTEGPVSASRRNHGERGVWQRRYWGHTIDSEDDFQRHFDYIHYNAVKHGHVTCPKDWPYSTFHRWLQAGVYAKRWGCSLNGILDFNDLNETAMEMDGRP